MIILFGKHDEIITHSRTYMLHSKIKNSIETDCRVPKPETTF